MVWWWLGRDEKMLKHFQRIADFCCCQTRTEMRLTSKLMMDGRGCMWPCINFSFVPDGNVFYLFRCRVTILHYFPSLFSRILASIFALSKRIVNKTERLVKQRSINFFLTCHTLNIPRFSLLTPFLFIFPSHRETLLM